jgi:long-subunit acyl-CoA synthetase (AMP-forming)
MKSTNLNLAEILASNLSSISEIETGITLSSEQLKFAIIKKMESHSLVNQLNPGHCVVLLKNNSIEFFIDFLAFYFLGVTVIPLDESQHADDIERVILFSKANLIIDSTGTHKRYTESQSELVGIAIVLFTSGTTGTPKGVLISKEALVLKLETLHQQISSAEIKKFTMFSSYLFWAWINLQQPLPTFLC